MSFSTYMLGISDADVNVKYESAIEEDVLFEEDFPKDTSGMGKDEFGVDKLEQPSKEGMDAAVDAMDQFAVASDGRDTDVNLSFHDSFPKDTSGFEKDANQGIPNEEEFVDTNTVPTNNQENDQFEAEIPAESVPAAEISPEELAKDDVTVEESASAWDDLFI